ncbi:MULTISPECIES: sulfatase-like hydrolase/transferase [unclassified Lentimonas]|uniref:sulfatase-like hydrolase/transferase n=1 Tax=unclassified Lentimonas TaxID=2630993 RepID=UPI00132824E6|nr:MULTISPECIES: sulfatase-like hydrolase/transferase [unclassified Lentimonas]CAA6677015.1 Choline-sulfatase (EC [Lentimonas sp. CC4]CAA6686821.1 Choline-sulfatase (EC [Lentimonas sp. CC6]CAA7075601.1 Choline-sulfatase (EC [Lentimonas sp. CC4]CAA7168242.1 Choline-sulfatase (EC [Lentimonas sp. CC21]CAA7181607.1 Choline-sulfatase (EC [Lentimonas sp. CC8]
MFPKPLFYFLLLSAATLSAVDRPNVLFIAIDDLVPTLGCYGDALAITPEIDTLAGQGTTFLNHHVQWSVCGPSRAALTTSLMPEETGVTGFKAIRHPDYLPDVITMPQHFKNNGYETACSGKFHDNRTVGTPGTTLTNNQYADGNTVDDPASWSLGWVKETNVYNPVGKPAVDYANDTDADFTDHIILTNGLSLIDQIASGSKPFFLAVGFKKPHLGFVAPTKYWDQYDSNGNGDYTDDIPLPTFTDHPANVDPASALEATLDNNDELRGYEPFDVTGLPTDAQARELRHGYYACVSFVDKLVGDLLDKLAATDDPVQVGKKMSETTIVVLWGDHGFYLGEHTRWAKHGATERATAAPLIVYDPRNPSVGAKSNSPVNAVDIYPTLCELAGLPIPEQPLSDTVITGRPLRGRSLVPVLNDADVSVNGGAMSQFNKNGLSGYSYRSERYRLIEWVNGSGIVAERNLFDYQGVGGLETVDVAADADYASVLHQLSVAMRAEPTTQGMAELQSSAAKAPPADLGVPSLMVAGSSSTQLELNWPATSTVTYRVLSNDDLVSPWLEVSGFESVVGGAASVTMSGAKRFYTVEVDDNQAPRFAADPILASNGTVDASYSATIASSATDPDLGASWTYSKVSGPAWLQVSTAGALSGTPLIADLGANYFMVSATDELGAQQTAALQVTVVEASVSGTMDTFTVVADTYAKESAPTAPWGGVNYIELRQMDASNFERIGYLQFSVAGVGTVTSAKLWLHSSSLTSQVQALATSNYLADGTTPWTELNLIWNNKPTVGLELGSGAAVVGEWFSIDVTSYITGNGTFSIALDEQANNVGKLDSKEVSSGTLAPYLEVVWE